MKKYKTYKVFDCQEMPKEIRKDFFENRGESKSNDCYVEYYVADNWKPLAEVRDKKNIVKQDKVDKCCYERGDDVVSDWLMDNGAKIGEEVLVKHWW